MIPYLLIIEVLVAVGIIVVVLGTSLKIIRPTQRGLVERFGKYNHFANQGLTFLIPIMDRLIRVNITERMSPVEPQDIITKDKVFLKTDAVIFYKIKSDEPDVKNSEYNVANFQSQIDTLARTVLRDIIGNMDMSEANVSRPIINEKLKAQLDLLTNQWGIEITRAEIKDIIPPKDLLDSMEQVQMADNKRQAAEKNAIAVATQAKGEADAAINTATGQRQSAILQAEGNRQSQILNAEGERQALILVAEGQAQATKLTNEAINTYFVGNAIKFKELEVTQKSLEYNTKVIVPENKSLSLILDSRDELSKKETILPIQTKKTDQTSMSES